MKVAPADQQLSPPLDCNIQMCGFERMNNVVLLKKI